ncbi:MAG: HAMP domain-containing histidine kinase, partial [Defluviitaleaceae bacterium]|nr:HAMP domain-containing histidine kinase [Defluviitaleaceae bacterium]
TTSSSFEEIFKSVFGNFNFKNIRGYIIDENGYVRIDSALLVKTHENGIPIRPYPRIPETYYGSALQNAIDYHLTKISQETGIFEYREFTTTTTTTTTTTSLFKYASIFPIMGTEWSIVILSNYIGPLDSTLYFTMIIVSILSILVYISISSYITHKHLINPINKLKKSIENSSYTYDETHEENLIFGTDLKGEVGDIARTISKMRLDLKENLNELSLLEKSKELSDNKDKFFKMLTSRVSSPAKTLINIINAEEKNEKIPDDFKPVFSEINRIAFLLLNRLDSMTFLSKIEDDKEVVKAPKSYETAELVNDIVKISKFYLNKRPIKFEVSVDSQIPNSLIGYKRLLVLITTDLLSNSFNWTDDGGKVKLSFKFIPANNLEITIEDDGVGIDPDELKKLQEDLNLIKENKVKYLKSNSLELIQIMLNFLEGELSIQSELYKGTIIKIKIPQSLN